MESTPSPSPSPSVPYVDDPAEGLGHPVEAVTSSRSPWWSAALVGALAGLVASAVMLWAGDNWGGVILPQLISDRATIIVPLDMFRRGLEALEGNAKPSLLIGLTAAQVLAGAFIALGYRRFARRDAAGRIVGGLVLTAGIWLFLSLVAAPLGAIGVFALDAPGELWRTQAVFIITAVVFGATVASLVPLPIPGRVGEDAGRRSVLRAGGMAALAIPALLATGYVGRYTRDLRRKGQVVAPTETTGERVEGFGFAGMPPEITPTDEFYVVSKNFTDPRVSQMNWTLELSGLVDRPMSLSVTDVTTRESVEFASTLCCISNPVGGKYISTAIWQGFPLRDLLEEAGLQDGVVDIELHAEDGYVESIPLAEALAPDTMLVHSINGELLPDLHGAPLRLIVPNIYGMKNVKWITKIIAVDRDVQGYWQERGWSDVAIVETMSRIDAPKSESGVPVGQPVQIGGVAFAGDRGISKVEISLDRGATWLEADLAEPTSALSWRLWKHEYLPTVAGVVDVLVRATDGAGALQIAEERDALPDGATGYDRMSFEVV